MLWQAYNEFLHTKTCIYYANYNVLCSVFHTNTHAISSGLWVLIKYFSQLSLALVSMSISVSSCFTLSLFYTNPRSHVHTPIPMNCHSHTNKHTLRVDWQPGGSRGGKRSVLCEMSSVWRNFQSITFGWACCEHAHTHTMLLFRLVYKCTRVFLCGWGGSTVLHVM